jgi:steroid delta-isomerase-like uncharacterized protein
MPGPDLAARLHASADAMNNRDWTAFFADVDPAVVYEDLGTGLRVQGREAWQEVFQRYLDAVPDLRSRYDTVTSQGNRVVGELVIEGTQTGEMVLPGGRTVPATGRRFVARAVLVADTDDEGRMTHVRHYTNPMGTLVQLGLVEPLVKSDP